MPIPDVQGIADAAATVVDALALSSQGSALKVYATEPREFDRLPAAAMRFEGLRRRRGMEADVQLGGAEWELTYAITLAHGMDDPDAAQRGLAELGCQVVAGVDASGTLGRVDVLDAVCEEAQQEFTDPDDSRQMAMWFIRLTVIALAT